MQGPLLSFSDRNACLQYERSEICTMRSLVTRTIMKPNFGWFSAICANHGIGTEPGLHIVFEPEKPISPFGFAAPRRPHIVGLPMSKRLPSRPATVLDWDAAVPAMKAAAATSRRRWFIRRESVDGVSGAPNVTTARPVARGLQTSDSADRDGASSMPWAARRREPYGSSSSGGPDC